MSQDLLDILSKREECARSHGLQSGAAMMQDVFFCIQLSKDLAAPSKLVDAQRYGWPTEIEWSTIPDRLVSLRPSLEPLVKDKSAMERTRAFRRLSRFFEGNIARGFVNSTDGQMRYVQVLPKG